MTDRNLYMLCYLNEQSKSKKNILYTFKILSIKLFLIDLYKLF